MLWHGSLFNSCFPSPSRVDYAKAHLRQCQQHCTSWNRCTDCLFGSSRCIGWLHLSPKCNQAEYKYLHSTHANKSSIYDHSSPCSLKSDLVRFVQSSLSCVFHLYKCRWSQWWCIIELLLLLLVNKWIRSSFGCVAAAAAALCRSRRSKRSKESWNVVVTTYLQFSPTKNWDIWQPLTIRDVQGRLFGWFWIRLRYKIWNWANVWRGRPVLFNETDWAWFMNCLHCLLSTKCDRLQECTHRATCWYDTARQYIR